MWRRRSNIISAFERTTSELRERIQQLECEQADLRARFEGETQLHRVTANIADAAQTALAIGLGIEYFAAAMRKPLRRGRAGGIARAVQARKLYERWTDGRYMSHEDWEEIERKTEEAAYMRHAAGGFARAASGLRAADGTFLPRVSV